MDKQELKSSNPQTPMKTAATKARPDDPIPEWYYITPYDSSKRRIYKQNTYKAWCKVRGIECDFSVLSQSKD